jgi:mycothiol synthase
VRERIVENLTPEDVGAVTDLLRRATAVDPDQRFPLSDEHWLALQNGGGDGFLAVLAPADAGERLTGYAQLSLVRDTWSLEMVVDPDARAIATHLLEAALDGVSIHGGGELRFWLRRPTLDDESVVAAHGFAHERDLLQMRRPLPTGIVYDLPTRSFRVGADEEAWLAVNNRAFASHPEQGGWTRAEVAEREAQPWFDPDGFRLHEVVGRLAGFCWTKVHADEDPPLGEIYVIAVDPDFEGRGLGRDLTLAGLDHLASTGVTIGMLYVDGGNEHAVRMYEKLGFSVHHLDRSYLRRVPGVRLS